MAVSSTRHGRLYYLDPGRYEPRIGDKMLVPTGAGPEVDLPMRVVGVDYLDATETVTGYVTAPHSAHPAERE